MSCREFVLDPSARFKAATPGRPEREAPGRGGAGLSQEHILTAPPLTVPDATRQKAQVEVWQGGTLVRIQRDAIYEKKEAKVKRGAVHDFSSASRRRLLNLLATLRNDAMPKFITLTLPGETAVTPERFASAFHCLRMAAQRTFPECSAVWKKELQDRKPGEFQGEVLPHFHLLGWGFPDHKFPYRRYVGKWVSITQQKGVWIERIWALENGTRTLKVESRMTEGAEDRFLEWLSRMWYEYVASGEFKHFKAGTACEGIRSIHGVKRYATKYLGKEQIGAGSPFAVGRYWGVWQKQNLPFANRQVYECTDKQAVQLMRVARRYFEKRTGRKSRLGHSVIKLFVNDSAQWEKLIVSILDG